MYETIGGMDSLNAQLIASRFRYTIFYLDAVLGKGELSQH